jgi:DNA transformation protein
VSVSAEYRAFVEDQLGRVMAVRSRRMFGGLGFYSGDRFFALADDDTLYFKVDDETRPRYEEHRMRPFNPMGTPMNGYWQVPVEVLEDVDALRDWAGEAVEVAVRAKGARRTRRPKGRRS